MRFVKKPVEVDAVKYDGPEDISPSSTEPPGEWPGVEWEPDSPVEPTGLIPVIKTLEGTMRVMPGDWIITGVEGEHYPCKPSVFEKSYAPIPEPPPEGVVDLAEERIKRDHAAGEAAWEQGNAFRVRLYEFDDDGLGFIDHETHKVSVVVDPNGLELLAMTPESASKLGAALMDMADTDPSEMKPE